MLLERDRRSHASAPPLPRRGFLRSLAALPLVGGSVSLVGAPTAAAVPATPALLSHYAAWLGFERYRALCELHGAALGTQFERHLVVFGPAVEWHHAETAEPSTRAAVVLSAAGVPLAGGHNG